MRLLFFRSDGFYPHLNQAIETYLLDMVDEDTEILYLWQNDKTAFIGKNQNAYTECKTEIIARDGGFIARRISGGGAVFHDAGNLNFTFVSAKQNYDKAKNFRIMTQAMRSLGFDAQLNGRNDVVIDGRKFSGNAFYKGSNACFHHGTVLIRSDKTKMSSYLNVPTVKLKAKGVESVVSRVVNLSELDGSVTADTVADALKGAFESYYGQRAQVLTMADFDGSRLDEIVRRYSDPDWIMGDNIFYDMRAEVRCEWGTADVRLEIKGNTVVKAKIYSDCLDVGAVAAKEALLVGADLYKGKQGVEDILSAFGEQKIWITN